MLIARDAIAEALFSSKTTLCEKLECPVDGRESDARMLLLDDLMQLFRAGMSFGLEKNVEDRLALHSPLKTGHLQMIEEDFLFLLHAAGRF